MRTQRRIGLVILVVTMGCLAVLAVLVAWFGVWLGAIVGVATALAVIACYVISIGPWQRRWGATDVEVERAMPGDEILGPGAPSTTRAITVDAPPDQVFPWLMQIGYGRGGWYSYDWLDNDGEPSVDRIDPALQRLAPAIASRCFRAWAPWSGRSNRTTTSCRRVRPTPGACSSSRRGRERRA